MVFWLWLCDDEKSEGKGDKIMNDNGDDEYDYDYGDDDDASLSAWTRRAQPSRVLRDSGQAPLPAISLLCDQGGGIFGHEKPYH